MVKVGGQAEGGFSLLLEHRYGAVVSVGDRDVHNPQDRLRRPLVPVRYPINSD